MAIKITSFAINFADDWIRTADLRYRLCQLKFIPTKFHTIYGQWLWLSWYSGRFQFQRSPVQIPSSAINYIEHFNVNCIEKAKIKKKGWEWRVFLKKDLLNLVIFLIFTFEVNCLKIWPHVIRETFETAAL